MRKLLVLAVLAGLGYGAWRFMDYFSGGGKGPVNPATQLKSGRTAADAATAAMAKAAVESVQRAVNGFRDAEGRLPASLQELVEKKYIESVPAGVTYDPATGTVSAG